MRQARTSAFSLSRQGLVPAIVLVMNIVYALTKNVYHKLIPSVRSLVEHNPDAKTYILAEDNEIPGLPCDATIINVSNQQWFPRSGVNYFNQFKYINLLKVRYPTYLSELDKVIHLDIDTIIVDNLQGMWDTDVDGKWFAAVPEYKGTYRPFGNMYYNMGIALINLEQMRKDNIESTMTQYLNDVPQPWADQDAWNKYAIEQDKAAVLDIRYNENKMTGYTDNPAIVHYCSISNWWEDRGIYRHEFLDRYR